MSEYRYGFDDLRGDILGVMQSMSDAHAAQQKLDEAMAADLGRVWGDIAELRDDINAVANRLEALTRAVTTSPAEVAAAIVNDANRSTLREVRDEAESYYYVCDSCGSLVTVTDSPLPEGEQWECSECGSEAAWEFTDAEAARLHAAHIQRGNASGLFRDPA